MLKNYKKRIIFVLPPKNWFYGIDYVISKSIIQCFEKKYFFKVIEFNEIEIFLKKKKNNKRVFKNYVLFFLL